LFYCLASRAKIEDFSFPYIFTPDFNKRLTTEVAFSVFLTFWIKFNPWLGSRYFRIREMFRKLNCGGHVKGIKKEG